ncbi:hypothetical protein BKA70DRAFT_1493957 [Coprinopsis sp. MPI-PUGE-AT-0042]|nr:hypothetical protein BKA70DRAFT_1493957 [Coprinopsis sp. MPI-PUGE-AT-0042]
MQPDLALFPYLSNNDPLPDHLETSSCIYLAHISSTISSLEQRLSDIGVECPQDELQRRKDEYREHSAPHSAIRRIPAETIAQILCSALYGYMPLNREGRAVLYQLIGVCSHWRRAALATHEIWTELSVSAEEVKGISESVLMKRICDWFSRAGTRQLRLDLSGTNGIQSSEVISYLTSLPRLSQLSVLPMKSFGDFYQIITPPNKRSLITRLTIRFYNNMTRLRGLNSLDQAFPELKDFSLLYKTLGSFPLVTHMQLRALHLCRTCFPPETSLSDYLCSLPALEELHAVSCYFPNADHSRINRDPATHPSLKHLLVSSDWTRTCMLYKADLPICPHLGRVTFLAPQSYTDQVFEAVHIPLYHGFVEECQPNRLTVDLSHLSDSTTFSILSHTKVAHQLNVPNLFAYGLPNALIRAAFWEPGPPPQTIVTRRPPRGFAEVFGNPDIILFYQSPALEELQCIQSDLYAYNGPIDAKSRVHNSLKHIFVAHYNDPHRGDIIAQIPRCPSLEKVSLSPIGRYLGSTHFFTSSNYPDLVKFAVVSRSNQLPLDLSLAPDLLSGMFTDAHRFHRLNVVQAFKAFARRSRFDQEFWNKWTEPLLRYREKIRTMKVYAPRPAADSAAVTEMAMMLQGMGIKIESFSQEENVPE